MPRSRVPTAARLLVALRLAALTAAAAVTPAAAQPAPSVTGRLAVDPAAGTLGGDLCVAGLASQRTRTFFLNPGLNIREVRTLSGRMVAYDGTADPSTNGDATRYVFTDSTAGTGFCVAYVGAYPVYHVDAGERSADDWKGQLAFNGRTVRATEQTRFYPVAVDSATGAALPAVTFRLDVVCPGCAALYMNGTAPAAGPRATFTSVTPRPLLLYAGAFPYTTVGGVHFVGGAVSPGDAALIAAGVRGLTDVHAAYLGVPFTDTPTFLTFAAVSRGRTLGRISWAFVTWPTIAMDGRVPFTALVDTAGGRRVFAPGTVATMAHKAAHFYFGTRYVPRGPLHWFLLESTAEYLSLRAVRARLGDSAYAAQVAAHTREATRAGPIVPLDSVRAAAEIGNGYRYHLGPLLLLALGRYVGDDALRRTLAGLVADPPAEEVDYAAFRVRVARAGGTDVALRRFEAECLHVAVARGFVAGLPDLPRAAAAAR